MSSLERACRQYGLVPTADFSDMTELRHDMLHNMVNVIRRTTQVLNPLGAEWLCDPWLTDLKHVELDAEGLRFTQNDVDGSVKWHWSNSVDARDDGKWTCGIIEAVFRRHVKKLYYRGCKLPKPNATFMAYYAS